MVASHLFPLSKLQPQVSMQGGFRLSATKRNFPSLKGMSFYKLGLNPKGVREPHWHANADELGYCLKGQVLVSIYATKNTRVQFLVCEGEAFFVPSGSLHAIENATDTPVELILQFSHEEPEDFSLSSSFGMFSNAVLGNTWDVSGDVFSSFQRSLQPTFITIQDHFPEVCPAARYDSPYRYSLAKAGPMIMNTGGAAKIAREDVWPIVKKQALYSLVLTSKGMREPHWHPETAELGYVHQGRGRMSILSPSGSVDTYEMSAGDIYFIPKAYPHHIENLHEEDLQLFIFFDQGMPGDIGFTASVKSYSDKMLASALNSPPDFFAGLPTYYEDRFIVEKVNLTDR